MEDELMYVFKISGKTNVVALADIASEFFATSANVGRDFAELTFNCRGCLQGAIEWYEDENKGADVFGLTVPYAIEFLSDMLMDIPTSFYFENGQLTIEFSDFESIIAFVSEYNDLVNAFEDDEEEIVSVIEDEV